MDDISEKTIRAAAGLYGIVPVRSLNIIQGSGIPAPS